MRNEKSEALRHEASSSRSNNQCGAVLGLNPGRCSGWPFHHTTSLLQPQDAASHLPLQGFDLPSRGDTDTHRTVKKQKKTKKTSCLENSLKESMLFTNKYRHSTSETELRNFKHLPYTSHCPFFLY